MSPTLERLAEPTPGACAGWLRRPLAKILRAVLCDPRARRFALHPARVLASRPATSASAEGRSTSARGRSTSAQGRSTSAQGRLAAAERELARVHRTELAYLLREAARLRTGVADRLATEACRDGLAEALECARRDRLALPPQWESLARACIGLDPSCWPRATQLALAALAAEPCESGRTTFARALESEGDARSAAAALAGAALTCASRSRGAWLLEELARVHEALGEARRARGLRAWARRAREAA